MNMTKIEMNDNMMERVNGGTFTDNTFTNEQYAKYGIKVVTHIIMPDQFYLPISPDYPVSEDMANSYIKRIVGEDTYKKMVKETSEMRSKKIHQALCGE